MNTSSKFKFISKNLSDLLTPIIGKQEIIRYINYVEDGVYPLNDSLPDIDTNLVNDGTIVLTIFNSQTLTELKCKLFFYPQMGSLEDTPVGVDNFILDIIIPNQYWVVNGFGELRAFEIAYHISNSIDNKLITGAGKVKITGYKSGKVDDNYNFLSLFIKVGSVTNA